MQNIRFPGWVAKQPISDASEMRITSKKTQAVFLVPVGEQESSSGVSFLVHLKIKPLFFLNIAEGSVKDVHFKGNLSVHRVLSHFSREMSGKTLTHFENGILETLLIV